MVSSLLLVSGGAFIILAGIVIGIILLYWWLKLRKIRKKAPQVDVEDGQALHQINYDPVKRPFYKSNAKPQVKPQVNTEPIAERRLEDNNEEKINEIEREISETQREIAKLRAGKQSEHISTGNGGVTISPTRESFKLNESVPNPDTAEVTADRRKARKNHKRSKSDGWEAI